jgi:hypothetical protein
VTPLEKYTWEATHLIVIAGVITVLMLGTLLFGVPFGKIPHVSEPAAISQPVPAVGTEQSDPRKVTVGPREISNRYTLLSVDRRAVSSERDALVVKLHIESLAMDGLASPFESDMLDITSPGVQPIKPRAPFRFPVPSGTARDQEIVFGIPPSLDLNHATLRIHYYIYQGEIPLKLASGKGGE